MSRHLVAFGIVLAVFSAQVFGQSGRLEAVRQELDGPSSSSSSSSSCKDTDDGDDGFGSLVGGLLTALFSGNGEEGSVTAAWFPAFPYANGEPGYMTRTTPDARKLACRLSVEAGDNFDDLTRFGGQFWVETTSGFGLSVRGNHYRESLPCGCTDTLTRGTMDVTYRLLEDAKYQFYIGAGGNWLDDNRQSHGGFNLMTGIDCYPAKPFILSGVLDVGTIADATATHARASCGVIIRRVELMTGYDWLRIGRVTLDGPFVGVRVWF